MCACWSGLLNIALLLYFLLSRSCCALTLDYTPPTPSHVLFHFTGDGSSSPSTRFTDSHKSNSYMAHCVCILLCDFNKKKVDPSKTGTLEAAAKPEPPPPVQEEKKSAPKSSFMSLFKNKVSLVSLQIPC